MAMIKITQIKFLADMEQIEDIQNDSLDAEGDPRELFNRGWLISQIDKTQMDFLEPGCPFIIVRKLTMEVIEKAIDAYTQDNAYWLKLHHQERHVQDDQDKAHDSFDIN